MLIEHILSQVLFWGLGTLREKDKYSPATRELIQQRMSRGGRF